MRSAGPRLHSVPGTRAWLPSCSRPCPASSLQSNNIDHPRGRLRNQKLFALTGSNGIAMCLGRDQNYAIVRLKPSPMNPSTLFMNTSLSFRDLNEVVGRKNLTPEHDFSGSLQVKLGHAWRFSFCANLVCGFRVVTLTAVGLTLVNALVTFTMVQNR